MRSMCRSWVGERHAGAEDATSMAPSMAPGMAPGNIQRINFIHSLGYKKFVLCQDAYKTNMVLKIFESRCI